MSKLTTPSKSLCKTLLGIHQWLWQRVIHSASLSDSSLRFCRILLPTLYLIFYMPDFTWIASMPDAWYDPAPLSIGSLFSGFPPLIFFQLAQSALILSAFAIIIGFNARRCGLLFCFLHVLINSFEYGFGKIDHVAHVFTLCFFCLSCSNWGAANQSNKYNLPIRGEVLLALLVTFGMFTAGFEKALRWIDFDTNTSGFLSWYFGGYNNLDRNELLAPYLTQFPRLGLELFDYAAVAFELSPFLFLLLGKRAWTLWVTTACCFHAGTTALLNISFCYQIFGYIPFLLPALPYLQVTSHSIRRKWMLALALVAACRLLPVWNETVPLSFIMVIIRYILPFTNGTIGAMRFISFCRIRL